MGIPRLIFLGISLGIIAFAITSGAYKLPGQIAGTVANPLLVDNKFCSDPASPNQTGCVSFISSALAQTMSSPYQNVSGPVSISGNVDVSGNIKLGDSRATSALVIGNFGHIIGREATDGSLKIGGGQANINLLNKTTLFFTDNGGTGSNPSISINQGGTNDARIGFEIRGVTGWEVGIDNSDGDKFKISNSTGVGDFTATGLTIDTTGSVGIGTATPTYKLQLSTDSAGKPNGGSWANSSDKRLKKNVRPITNALDKISQLQGVDFEWINPTEHGNMSGTQGGFIAQDVEKIFPAWISRIDPSGKDINLVPVEDKIKSLTLPFEFDALLVESIKEQQKQITSLLNIIDYVNKIGRFIKVETQKLIVSGVDILERLNSLSQKIEAQQKEIDLLKQEIETLKAR